MDTTVMGPAFAVLGVGAVVGVLAALRVKNTDSTIVAETERIDLASTYNEVMLALKQLDLEKAKLDPADYQAERTALLARGASALRELQGDSAPVGPVAAYSLSSLPDLPMTPGADSTLEALRTLLDEHGSERFRAAIVSLAKERPKAVVPGLAEGAGGGAAPIQPQQKAAFSKPQPQGVSSATSDAEPVMAPQYQGALAVLAILALLAALYYVAIGDTVDRREGASMTGNQDLGVADAPMQGGPPGAAPLPASVQAEVKGYEQRIKTNAADLEALNGLTEIYLGIGDAGKAMEYNNKAFEVGPTDPTVLTFKAVLRAMVGMFQPAIESLEAVVASNPDHAMAWTYLGLIQVDKGDRNRGLEAMRKAVELQPDNFGLKQALDRAEKGLPLAGGGPPPGGGGQAAAGAPPASVSPGEPIVSGRISLADGVTAAGTEVVFVSLRNPAGGPPIAAKKYRAADLPVDFTITTGDQISMGGAPKAVPASFTVNVRLDVDNDGNAFTKTPLDPTSSSENVSKGATGLAIQLATP